MMACAGGQTPIDSYRSGRYHAGIFSCQVILQSLQGAGVAQLVEQRFRKPQVARSIRVAGSICAYNHIDNPNAG